MTKMQWESNNDIPSEKDAKRKLFRNVANLTSFYFCSWKLFWSALYSQPTDLDWNIFKKFKETILITISRVNETE